MDETAIKVIVEFAAFCKLNDPADLNPRVAEWGLMRLRDILGESLSEVDRRALVAWCESEVEELHRFWDEFPRARDEGGWHAFVRELPDTLNLRGE
jgi:hypothetical protein